MPTKKKRVMMTLDDDMLEILKRHQQRLSVGKAESLSGAAVDLIERGLAGYIRDHPELTIAANADNLEESKREAAIKSAAERAAAKYWSKDDDDERGKDR